MITDVPGIEAGHWTGKGTGVTVILCPDGTIGSAEVRGGAPATREIALLDPVRTVEAVHAVVFAGGSAFGLAVADGVMSWLAEQPRGVPTTGGVVPIVPTACIYDLTESSERPRAEHGRAAIDAATPGERLQSGRVGAGAGATVGKWRGAEYSVPGGIGGASARVTLNEGDATIGALVVVNAVGDVIDESGAVLAGSTAPADAEMFPEHKVLLEEETQQSHGRTAGMAERSRPGMQEPNTTLVAVATDAKLTKLECHLLAQSAHHGLARALRPSHTRFDGDLAIVLSTGSLEWDGPATGVDRLRSVATEVVAEAIREAVRQT